MPLRSSARILRLWFKPWEDADRDLYDQGYVYVQIDGGQWLIEHAQRQIREAYAPLRPPPRSAASAPASANEPKEDFGARPPVKGPARPPSGGDLLPGLMPPASRPEITD
jgi:conjugal transfer pilus assembly protein TraV